MSIVPNVLNDIEIRRMIESLKRKRQEDSRLLDDLERVQDTRRSIHEEIKNVERRIQEAMSTRRIERLVCGSIIVYQTAGDVYFQEVHVIPPPEPADE